MFDPGVAIPVMARKLIPNFLTGGVKRYQNELPNPNLDISQFFQADSYSKNIISLYGSFSICFTPLSSSDNLIHSKIKVKGRFESNLYKLFFG